MDGNGFGKGGGDGGRGAPRWTTTNAPHYKTLNLPVYSGNGRHCERSENGLGYISGDGRLQDVDERIIGPISVRGVTKGTGLVCGAYFSEL